jgi:hypothetical protein
LANIQRLYGFSEQLILRADSKNDGRMVKQYEGVKKNKEALSATDYIGF